MNHGGHEFFWLNRFKEGEYSGFALIDKKAPEDNPTKVMLPFGETASNRHESLVQIRKTFIAAYVDGRLVARYETNYSDLSIPKDQRIEGDTLGVRTKNLTVEIETLELIDVTGSAQAGAQNSGAGLKPSTPSVVSAPPPTASTPAMNGAAVPAGLQPGLIAELFSDDDFAHPVKTRIDRQIYFNWGKDGPDQSIPGGHFSVRWNGRLLVSQSGDYTFIASVDNEMTIWIDGHQAMRVPKTTQGAQERASLTQGLHDIRIDYRNTGGVGEILLQWKREGLPVQGLGRDVLWHDASATAGKAEAPSSGWRSDLIGGRWGSDPFQENAPPNTVLIGFECSKKKMGTGLWAVRSVKAIYLGASGEIMGQTFGQSDGPVERIAAKPGYAVGTIKARTSGRVDGMQIHFMRLQGDALLATDAYDSELFGETAGDAIEIGEGRPVVGLYGIAGANLDALGLIANGSDNAPPIGVDTTPRPSIASPSATPPRAALPNATPSSPGGSKSIFNDDPATPASPRVPAAKPSSAIPTPAPQTPAVSTPPSSAAATVPPKDRPAPQTPMVSFDWNTFAASCAQITSKRFDSQPLVVSSEKYGWTEVPQHLSNGHARVLNRWSDNKDGGGNKAVAEFEVTTSGYLLLACNYAYEGNDSGGWTNSRLTKDGFIKLGWQVVDDAALGGSLISGGKQRVIFWKWVTRGESFNLRCNKYGPPCPIFLPNPQPGAAASLQPQTAWERK